LEPLEEKPDKTLRKTFSKRAAQSVKSRLRQNKRKVKSQIRVKLNNFGGEELSRKGERLGTRVLVGVT